MSEVIVDLLQARVTRSARRTGAWSNGRDSIESGRRYRLYRSFPLSITAARRNSLFLTSAGPPDFRKRDPRYFVQATIFIAIVMVITDSGIASARASHVVGRLGI